MGSEQDIIHFLSVGRTPCVTFPFILSFSPYNPRYYNEILQHLQQPHVGSLGKNSSRFKVPQMQSNPSRHRTVKHCAETGYIEAAQA